MSTQPAWNRPRPHLEKEPQIRTALRQARLPQNRSCRQRVNTKTPTPAEDAPSGSRAASLGSVLSPYGASSCHTGAPPYSSTRSQSARIGNCDVRRGRTSPPDDCVHTSVTWRRTQSSDKKYVLIHEGASSRADSWESTSPSRLSRTAEGASHQTRCAPSHTHAVWPCTPSSPSLIP